MMLLAICLAETVLVLTFSGFIRAFYALLRPVSKYDLPDSALPFVSVIVPARNEETKIARCLESLARQDYPNFELVVIDDRSTDQTASIIEELAGRYPVIKFVKGKKNPDGWVGKCNALVQAVGQASGQWFLFTDADTCHVPTSLRDSVCHGLYNQADLVSFVPLQELGSFWERLIMPLLLGSFLCGDPLHTVNDSKNSRAYAYGQYILVRRSAYLAIGGHQAVRDEIVEDHALGRVFKQQGYKILVADGSMLYSVRMYTSLKTLWQGWTKNLYSLIECRPVYLFLVLLLINACVLGPLLEASFLTWMACAGERNEQWLPSFLLTGLQLLALSATYQKTSQHLSGVDWRHFFLVPLGSPAVTALYLNSAYRVHTGARVDWKGRSYRVNTSKTIDELQAGSLESGREQILAPETSD